jgi:hypothetical protein
MAYSASSHAACWSAIDRERSQAWRIDHIALNRGFVALPDSDSVAGSRRRPDILATSGVVTTIASLSPRSRRVGRLEQMVMDARQLSPMRSRILGVLLAAANPASCGGNATLQPLWANEAMHRAHQMVRLTGTLDRKTPCEDKGPAEADLEWRIATVLSETLLSLRIARDAEKLPCSEVLRDAVRDLVELFGEAVGISGISTSIERLELASFKRRALVLLAGHLVIEALLFAVRTRHDGQVLVILDRPCAGFGRLAVGFDDHTVPFGPLDGSHGVIDDLASLLESDVSYRADCGRIVAGVEFSLR